MKVIQFDRAVPAEERAKALCSKVIPRLEELMQKLNDELEYWERAEMFCRSQMDQNVPGAEFTMWLVQEMQNSLCFTIREVFNNLIITVREKA